MKLANIITEEITLDELERVVRNVHIDQIKKQMKKLRANDKKTHHMFFVAVKGKTLADKIKNDTIKVLNKTIKKKPDILKRMNASQAEKEIRNNVSLLAAQYILAAQKDK